MDSTPDQPVTPPEEPGDDAADVAEPVVPPESATPPEGATPPGIAPVAADAWPPPPPPPSGHPPIEQAPVNPYAAVPLPPGQWQQGPGSPGYGPGPWMPPAPTRKGLSFGAGLGIGIAIGIVAHVLGIVAMFAVLSTMNGDAGIIGLVWPFLLIAIAAVVMMFFRATRPYATGVLIIAAAMWLVIIGPCIMLLGGFS
ncbi:hypothetical protein ACU045_07370 [Microbacterium sp. MAHUQ-60]|uniref:hypothetical protein n=1 Tax=unclassified Microbacterium TaxID=2609290 RepID=UPI00361101C1